MNFLPIQYDEPLFRPPSEAYSLILQISNGCSWNRCTFCEMYTSKKFKIKKIEDIKADINKVIFFRNNIRKVFLADGDAMVLSTNKLLDILNTINKNLPKVRRISVYAKPKDLLSKSINELKMLNKAGLSLVYVGIESGDNKVLSSVNKGETYESTLNGLLNARKSGIKTSVMILNGLGGKQFSERHAINSAKILNEIQPEFASTLVLYFPFGQRHFEKRYSSNFTPLNKIELIMEMRLFIENTKLENTIFRSDHASNHIVLKGILSKDKNKMLKNINLALINNY